jgi:hypothetical protein
MPYVNIVKENEAASMIFEMTYVLEEADPSKVSDPTTQYIARDIG